MLPKWIVVNCILVFFYITVSARPYPDASITHFVDITKEPYLADPTGTRDATQSFRDAINDLLSDGQPGSTWGNDNVKEKGRTDVIYIPNGTYSFSDRITLGSDKSNAERIRFLGESREKTIFRLASGTFTDPDNPRIFFSFFDPPTKWTGHNHAFCNSMEDITLDVSGNPGAIALRYHSNNESFLRHILIRGDGVTGLSIEGYLSGIGSIRDIEIDGFDYGIKIWSSIPALVFERITLKNQSIAGVFNDEKPVSIRKLTSVNAVPAIINKPGQASLVLIDSYLKGDNNSATAIINDAMLFARNVHIEGYGNALEENGNTIQTDYIDEHVTPLSTGSDYESDGVYTLWEDTPKKSLHLGGNNIPDQPEVTWDDPHEWVVVHGNTSDDIQAAIDSANTDGKTTVFLPKRLYTISKSVRIWGSVRRFHGGYSVWVHGNELKKSGTSMMTIEAGSHPVIVIEGVDALIGNKAGNNYYFIQNNSDKTVVLKDLFTPVAMGTYRNADGGTVFIENVATGETSNENTPPFDLCFTNQMVWARSFNPEVDGFTDASVINDGGSFWALGFKTECSDGVLFKTIRGGKTELLGGLFNTLTGEATGVPMLICDNASLSVTAAQRTRVEDAYATILEETRGSQTRRLAHSEFPVRDESKGSVFIPLLVAGKADLSISKSALNNGLASGTSRLMIRNGQAVFFLNRSLLVDGGDWVRISMYRPNGMFISEVELNTPKHLQSTSYHFDLPYGTADGSLIWQLKNASGTLLQKGSTAAIQ